ncbi:MAG TPA: hypothetical protein DCM54_03015 [Gammaproteobacteria bacterium]|nr:hypothetical protein [Gammaproteobacteria bacterium]
MMTYRQALAVTFALAISQAALAVVDSADPAEEILQKAQSLETDRRFRSALEYYDEAIALITELKGPHSIDLLEPLLGKGRSYLAHRRYEEAKDSLEIAQSIVRRQDGVYSNMQLEVLDDLANINLRSGEFQKANDLQKFAFRIDRDKHGDRSLDLLPAYNKIINWYLNTGQYWQVRRELNKVMELIQEEASEHDPRLIEYLRLVAKTRRLQGITKSHQSLVDALEVIENNPELPMEIKSDVYLELADAYTVRKKTKEAARYYNQAGLPNETEPDLISMTSSVVVRSYGLRILANFEVPLVEKDYPVKVVDNQDLFSVSRERLSRFVVGFPFQFRRWELIRNLGLRPNLNFSRMEVTYQFNVTSDGKVEDIELVASNAPTKLDKFMAKVLRKARFRPAFVDGIPSAKTDVTLTQSF